MFFGTVSESMQVLVVPGFVQEAEESRILSDLLADRPEVCWEQRPGGGFVYRYTAILK